jgi:hypothetical protein
MGGGRIVPRSLKTKGNKNCFQTSQKKIFFKSYMTPSYMTPLYFLKLVFLKFDPLTVTGIALCVDLGPKCQNVFCLV